MDAKATRLRDKQEWKKKAEWAEQQAKDAAEPLARASFTTLAEAYRELAERP
ncbi:MAG: hypothetical protein ISS15_06735 [Alphaproteobacteria bacterium]|nr:hypothetical protein [Alphaproteobacteria bacterium]MBL7097333.1 hypothetical protein [Alphaproteobacteria bacterium]